jgi:hypothetical protein
MDDFRIHRRVFHDLPLRDRFESRSSIVVIKKRHAGATTVFEARNARLGASSSVKK